MTGETPSFRPKAWLQPGGSGARLPRGPDVRPLGGVAAMRWSVELLAPGLGRAQPNTDDWWFFSRTGAMRTTADMDSITPAAEGVRTVTLRRYDPSLSRSWTVLRSLSSRERWEVDAAPARGQVVFAAIYGQDGAQVRAEGEGRWFPAQHRTDAACCERSAGIA